MPKFLVKNFLLAFFWCMVLPLVIVLIILVARGSVTFSSSSTGTKLNTCVYFTDYFFLIMMLSSLSRVTEEKFPILRESSGETINLCRNIHYFQPLISFGEEVHTADLD